MIIYSSCSCECLVFPQTGPLGFKLGTQKIRITLMTALWWNSLWNLASVMQDCGSTDRVRIQFSRGAFFCLHYEIVHETAIPFLISNKISNFYRNNCGQYSTYTMSFWFSLTHPSVAPWPPLKRVPCTSKSECLCWISLSFTFYSHNFNSAGFPFYFFPFSNTAVPPATAFCVSHPPNNNNKNQIWTSSTLSGQE